MPQRKRRMRKKSNISKTMKKEVRKIAQQVVDENVEDKRAVYLNENLQLNHNKPIYIGKFLSDINQGVNTGTDGVKKTVRVGDRIKLKNMNIRFWLSNKLDRPNVMYKGVLFWYPVDLGAAITDADVYFTQQNKMLDRYNFKRIKILDTFIVKSGPMYLNGTEKFEHSYLATLNKSWKNKYVQFEQNSTKAKGWELGFSLVAYDAYGTLQTDNIASYAINSQITFEDA